MILILTVLLMVLLPYEFTLLSNVIVGLVGTVAVLLPYEFTLLSNSSGRSAGQQCCFTTL